ncbi:MAG: ribosome silencing factor [Candidatus Eremiobacteraeota bacterium]|nr:ribosome silencing factor [Candidatus Eremiobacteraeota bacterium]
MALAAAHAALEKKAEEILILDMKKVHPVCDYFVIVSGNSKVHLKAIADAIEEAEERLNIPEKKIEGKDSATWILLDFGLVVVHIFREDIRRFYNLEELWIEAPELPLPEDFGKTMPD